jgi:hypothetical protein
MASVSFFEINCNFIEANKRFIFVKHDEKLIKGLGKHQRTPGKYQRTPGKYRLKLVDPPPPPRKYPSRDTVPLTFFCYLSYEVCSCAFVCRYSRGCFAAWPTICMHHDWRVSAHRTARDPGLVNSIQMLN